MEYLPFTWGIWKFLLENQMVRAFCDASENMGFDLRRCSFSTLFSLLSSFGYNVSGSFSRQVKFYSFMFMDMISIRMVCVNGNHFRTHLKLITNCIDSI